MMNTALRLSRSASAVSRECGQRARKKINEKFPLKLELKMSQSINYTPSNRWHILLFQNAHISCVCVTSCEFGKAKSILFPLPLSFSRSLAFDLLNSVPCSFPSNLHHSLPLYTSHKGKAQRLEFCLNRIYFDNRWRPFLRGLYVRFVPRGLISFISSEW